MADICNAQSHSATASRPFAKRREEPKLGNGIPYMLRLWCFRHQSRRDLAALSPERLNDLGIDRLAAQKEIHKPFWR